MKKAPDEVVAKVQQSLPPLLLHDLRTPLSHILGYSELLQEELKEKGNDDLILYVERIQNAGRQLLALMEANFKSGPPST